MDIEELKVTDAEIAEETAAQAPVEEEKIRSKVVADLGIEDNDSNKGLIDKLVNREVEYHGKLSKAVGQKIKYRELVNGGKPPSQNTSSKPATTVTDPVEAARIAAREEYESRDLAQMNYSDRVKDEIKKVATLNNLTVREAEKDSYVQYVIQEEVRQKSIDDAARNGGKRSQSGTVIDVSKPLDVSQFDLSTEEGRAEWAEAKKAKRQALQQ